MQVFRISKRNEMQANNCVAVRSVATQDEEDRNSFHTKYKALLKAEFRNVELLSKKSMRAGMRGAEIGVQISVEANLMLYILHARAGIAQSV